MATTTSLKLDPAVKERVQRIAAARRRTPHWIMREAVESSTWTVKRSESNCGTTFWLHGKSISPRACT